MSIIPAPFTFLATKNAVDIVGIAADWIKQSTFPSRLKVGHGCFNEMSGTVKLVQISQVGQTFLRFDLSEPEIEIAVRLLKRSDKVNRLINHCFELWIGMSRQAETG